MSSAEDYDAELAERYGWINRSLTAYWDGAAACSDVWEKPVPSPARVTIKINTRIVRPNSATDVDRGFHSYWRPFDPGHSTFVVSSTTITMTEKITWNSALESLNSRCPSLFNDTVNVAEVTHIVSNHTDARRPITLWKLYVFTRRQAEV